MLMPLRAISYPAGTALIDDRVFATDAINVISISGGKDSLAQWLLALAAGVKIIAAFADTGHEHPLTMKYLDYLESKLGPIRRVKADFTARIEGKRRFIAERWPVSLVTECGLTEQEAKRPLPWHLKPFIQPACHSLISACGRVVFRQQWPASAHSS